VAVPAWAGEQLDEFVLAGGGVLHLVDEQVLKMNGAGGFKIAGPVVMAESRAGCESEFRKVTFGAFGEDDLELGECTGKNAEEGLGDNPLLLRIFLAEKTLRQLCVDGVSSR
jgi:hypothetical protein